MVLFEAIFGVFMLCLTNPGTNLCVANWGIFGGGVLIGDHAPLSPHPVVVFPAIAAPMSKAVVHVPCAPRIAFDLSEEVQQTAYHVMWYIPNNAVAIYVFSTEMAVFVPSDELAVWDPVMMSSLIVSELYAEDRLIRDERFWFDYYKACVELSVFAWLCLAFLRELLYLYSESTQFILFLVGLISGILGSYLCVLILCKAFYMFFSARVVVLVSSMELVVWDPAMTNSSNALIAIDDADLLMNTTTTTVDWEASGPDMELVGLQLCILLELVLIYRLITPDVRNKWLEIMVSVPSFMIDSIHCFVYVPLKQCYDVLRRFMFGRKMYAFLVFELPMAIIGMLWWCVEDVFLREAYYDFKHILVLILRDDEYPFHNFHAIGSSIWTRHYQFYVGRTPCLAVLRPEFFRWVLELECLEFFSIGRGFKIEVCYTRYELHVERGVSDDKINQFVNSVDLAWV